MLNETIIETLDAVTPTGVIWWMKLLMIAGIIWLSQTLFKTGINIIYFLTYLVGLIIFIIKKIKRKK